MIARIAGLSLVYFLGLGLSLMLIAALTGAKVSNWLEKRKLKFLTSEGPFTYRYVGEDERGSSASLLFKYNNCYFLMRLGIGICTNGIVGVNELELTGIGKEVNVWKCIGLAFGENILNYSTNLEPFIEALQKSTNAHCSVSYVLRMKLDEALNKINNLEVLMGASK